MINSMPTGKAKMPRIKATPKPYVEENDSYLRPGMKDEPEGRAIPKKMPAKKMSGSSMMPPKKTTGSSKKAALIKQLGKITKKP